MPYSIPPAWTVDQALQEYPQLTKTDLKLLKDWCSKHNRVPDSITEEELVVFHHSCYFNLSATKKCIENYYDMKHSTPAFFNNRDPDSDELAAGMKALYYGIYPQRDPEGHIIMFHSLQNTDPQKYFFNTGVKILIMMFFTGYFNNGLPPGVTLVFDMKGVKIGHLTRLPLLNLRKLFIFVQEANPVRLKAIRVVNVHPLIDKIMMLIKPFLKKELLEIIHFYREDDPEVYKVLPKSCLPSDFGGDLEPVSYYHEKFGQELKRLRQVFLEEDEEFFGNNIRKKRTQLEFD